MNDQIHVLAGSARVKEPPIPIKQGFGWDPKPLDTKEEKIISNQRRESKKFLRCPALSWLTLQLFYLGSCVYDTELKFKFSKIVQESRVGSSVRGMHGIQEYHILGHIFTKTEVRTVRKPPTLNYIAATCAKTNLFAFTKFLSSRCFWTLITVIFSKFPCLGQEDNWIKILELFSLPSTTQKSNNTVDSLKKYV